MNTKIIKVKQFAAVLSLALFTMVGGGVVHAQTYSSSAVPANASLVAQVSDAANIATTLSKVEVARESILGTVGAQLTDIAFQVRGFLGMPMSTDSDRAALSVQVGAIASQVSDLTGIISATSQIHNQEVVILSALETKLLAIQTQL